MISSSIQPGKQLPLTKKSISSHFKSVTRQFSKTMRSSKKNNSPDSQFGILGNIMCKELSPTRVRDCIHTHLGLRKRHQSPTLTCGMDHSAQLRCFHPVGESSHRMGDHLTGIHTNPHHGVVSLTLDWLQHQQHTASAPVIDYIPARSPEDYQSHADVVEDQDSPPLMMKPITSHSSLDSLTRQETLETGPAKQVKGGRPDSAADENCLSNHSSGYYSHSSRNGTVATVRFEVGSLDGCSGLTPPSSSELSTSRGCYRTACSPPSFLDSSDVVVWEEAEEEEVESGREAQQLEQSSETDSSHLGTKFITKNGLLLLNPFRCRFFPPTHTQLSEESSEVQNSPDSLPTALACRSLSAEHESQPTSRSCVRSVSCLSRKERRNSLADLGYGKVNSYTKLEKLGQGTYASVYKGRSHVTESLVALKEIRLEHAEGAPCTAIREISLLRELQHANIVTLHDIVHTDRSLTLVFEYLSQDLKQYMEESDCLLHMENVRLFLYQLLRALNYCHKRHILHRDLKPQNLLIGERGDLKLADFGLARAQSIPSKTYSNEVVTLWYRPPDVLLGSTEYTTHIDMWGAGCIFFEMVAGRPCFPGNTVVEELVCIFKQLGTPTERTWHGVNKIEDFQRHHFPLYPSQPMVHLVPRLELSGQTLLPSFLRYCGSDRITAKDALKHSYFADHLPLDKLEKLPDTSSIFEVEGLHMFDNPGARCHQPRHVHPAFQQQSRTKHQSSEQQKPRPTTTATNEPSSSPTEVKKCEFERHQSMLF